MTKRLAGAAIALALSAAGAGLGLAGTETADYTPLDPDGEPLRGTFDAYAGKVRILMLLAPT